MKYDFKNRESEVIENRRYLYYSSGLLNTCLPKPEDFYVWNETLQKYENKDLY